MTKECNENDGKLDLQSNKINNENLASNVDDLKIKNQKSTSKQNLVVKSYNRNRVSYQQAKYTDDNKGKQTIDYSGINPEHYELESKINVEKDKFFVIKSFSAQDVYNSVIYKIWCSTENGNIKLNNAYKEAKADNGNVYLFFSVNGSGYFCGVAKMISEIDFCWQPDPNLWSHSTKWKGKFDIKWIYVKNVPNRQLSYIKLENNENKPVTHSRDCQLVPSVNGIHVMKIIHYYHHYSSILDNAEDYE